MMLDLIAAPTPVGASGLAMAHDLISDGTGPMYDRRRSADLASAVRAVIEHLEPSVPLLSA